MSRSNYAPAPRGLRSLRPVLAFALFASGACGCEPKSNENDSVGTLFRALCETNLRCGGAEPEEIDCSPERFCFYPELEPDMRLFGADSCAKQLADMDCDQYINDSLPSACETALLHISAQRGLSGLDGPCHSDADCHPDLLCSVAPDGESCGVCGPFPAVGERCGAFTPCASGAHCGDDERCHADAARGEACTDDGDCRALLSCVEGSCQPHSLRAGDACGAGVEGRCAGLLVCVDDRCQTRASLGEDCSKLSCGFGLVCVDDECVEPAACGAGQVGDPCYANVCAPGLTCHPLDSTCAERELGAIGDDCDGNGECESQVCIAGSCAENTCRISFEGTPRSAARTSKARTAPHAHDRSPLTWFGAAAR